MKKIKLLVMALVITCLCSGCVKFNATMDIKKDKSMNFKVVYALDKTYFGSKSIYTNKEKKNLEKEGFKLTKYKKDNMQGFTLERKIKNIDEISSDKKNINYTLSELSDPKKGKNSKSAVFKVKKGLFKNHYYAKFDFNLGDTNSNGIDMSKYVEKMDLTYDVKLPYKVIKTNAQEVSKDKTKLSWNLGTFKEPYMTYEFELYNRGIICGLVILILVIGVGVFFILTKFSGKKKVEQTKDEVKEELKEEPKKEVVEEKKEEVKTTPKKKTTTKKTTTKKETTKKSTTKKSTKK